MLSDMAIHRHLALSKLPPGRWQGLLHFAANFMARTPTNHTPIVKLNDNGTNLIGNLMSLNSNSNGFVLYSSLEDFLVSTLKDNKARLNWVRTRLQNINWTDYPDFSEIDVPNLSDEQACSCLWLLQMHIILASLAKNQKVRTLNSALFFDNQEQTLKQVCELFSIEANAAEIDNAIEVSGKTHSKSGTAFSTQENQIRQNIKKTQLSNEIDNAISWSGPWIERLGIPDELPNQLQF